VSGMYVCMYMNKRIPVYRYGELQDRLILTLIFTVKSVLYEELIKIANKLDKFDSFVQTGVSFKD
jgi:hypothetical protein